MRKTIVLGIILLMVISAFALGCKQEVSGEAKADFNIKLIDKQLSNLEARFVQVQKKLDEGMYRESALAQLDAFFRDVDKVAATLGSVKVKDAKTEEILSGFRARLEKLKTAIELQQERVMKEFLAANADIAFVVAPEDMPTHGFVTQDGGALKFYDMPSNLKFGQYAVVNFGSDVVVKMTNSQFEALVAGGERIFTVTELNGIAKDKGLTLFVVMDGDIFTVTAQGFVPTNLVQTQVKAKELVTEAEAMTRKQDSDRRFVNIDFTRKGAATNGATTFDATTFTNSEVFVLTTDGKITSYGLSGAEVATFNKGLATGGSDAISADAAGAAAGAAP